MNLALGYGCLPIIGLMIFFLGLGLLFRMIA